MATTGTSAGIEAECSALLDAVPSGIALLDGDDRIVFCNRWFEDLTGHRRDELAGNHVSLVLPDLDPERRKDGDVSERMRPPESSIRRRIGPDVVAGLHATPLTLEGSPFTMVTVVDAEARPDAARELRQRERRFRTMIDVAPVMMWTMGPDGLITSANGAFESVTGLRREELTGTHFVALLHSDDISAALAEASRVTESAASEAQEVRLRTPAGTHRVFDLTMTLVEAGGREAEILCVGHELTDSKRVEEALRESEERFRTIFERGPLGIVLVDRDLRVTDVNHAIERITGQTREQLVGARFPAINDPAEASADLEQMTRLLRGEIEGYRIEKRFVRASGENGYASITTSVIHDEHGAPLYTLRIVEDVTERRSLELAIAARSEAAIGVLGRLTVREREILSLLADGLTAPQMSAHLSVSTRTVETHLANAYRKLGVRSRADAVASFRQLSTDLEMEPRAAELPLP